MQFNSNVLAIFCRAPQLGCVKTRLAATLGDEFALGLYRAMLGDTFQIARENQPLGISSVAFVTPDDGDLSEFWDGAIQNQGEGDLWTRMTSADAILREKGAQNVVFIGSDAPDLSSFILRGAFYFCHLRDFVVGPSEDGGFYLLGASKPLTGEIFENVPISSDQTLAFLRPHLGESVTELPIWSDVDTRDDLNSLRLRLENGSSRAPKVRAFLERNFDGLER